MTNNDISKFPSKRQTPEPPEELATAGRDLWTSLQREYIIDDPAGLSSLLTACRAVDDLQSMRAVVAVDGLTQVDRTGKMSPHPLLAAIRGTELIKKQALRSLNLDATPPGKPGHPPNRGNAR
jgi:hypothetical protein